MLEVSGCCRCVTQPPIRSVITPAIEDGDCRSSLGDGGPRRDVVVATVCAASVWESLCPCVLCFEDDSQPLGIKSK